MLSELLFSVNLLLVGCNFGLALLLVRKVKRTSRFSTNTPWSAPPPKILATELNPQLDPQTAELEARIATQAAIAKREQYLAALVEVQQQLLVCSGGWHDYTQILQILGQVSGASRVYIFENHYANGYAEGTQLLMSQRAEWCAAGIQPEIDNPDLQNLSYADFFPRWAQRLAQGESVAGIVA